jgi:hypothetical protein
MAPRRASKYLKRCFLFMKDAWAAKLVIHFGKRKKEVTVETLVFHMVFYLVCSKLLFI